MLFKKLTLYQTKLLLQRTNNPVLLSFDLGVNSTGVAITDQTLMHAFPLKVIKSVDSRRDSHFAQQVMLLIKRHKPTALIFGSVNPKFVESFEQQSLIMDKLSKIIDIQTNYTQIDESNSTYDAKQLLKQVSGQMGLRGLHLSKNLQDAFAAIVILKRFIDYYKK